MASEHFLRAREVINREDPVGLLALGAPEDEYDPEVRDLISRPTAVTRARVREVFLKWFGEDNGRLPGPVVERIADQLDALRRDAANGPRAARPETD
jgi:hypothetical protein